MDSFANNSLSPLAFFSWLEQQSSISKDYSTNLKNYQKYVSDWHLANESPEETRDNNFIELYVDLLNEITLSFTTGEEKRFISNCNFNNPEELDIILPFFVQKLKHLCLYYYNKRENLKKKIQQIPQRGIKKSTESNIKNLILDGIDSEDLQVLVGTRFTIPPLSGINENLLIKIEELYDDSTYGNAPTKISELDIDPLVYLDIRQAITKAVQKYPVLLDGLNMAFSLNVSLSGNPLGYLKNRDFKDYFVSENADDLKLQLYRNFATKFMGCDMYYVSTGSTLTDFTSGKLFDTRPLSGNVVLNPYNRVYPGVATIPSLSAIVGSYYCGRFFVPSKTATLQYSTLDKSYFIDTKKLQPNKVYVFPDPSRAGNVVDAFGEENKNYPLVFEINLSHNKISDKNSYRFGDVLSTPLDHLFYPYQSESQEQYRPTTGLSTPYDSVTFWGGDKDTEWQNSDIWPDLSSKEKLPIDIRLDSLLIDRGQMVKWFTDIYGNEYGLFKQDLKSILDKRNKLGEIFVKTTSNIVSSFNYFFNNPLVKFPEFIVKEIQQGVINTFIINNTILIESENYIIIDFINYSYETDTFTPSPYSGFYRKKWNINKDIEKLVGYTYRSDNNSLYICFTTLASELSSTNYKKIIPQVYKFDISQEKILQVYPEPNSVISYSLSSSQNISPEIDIKYIESGHFSHKDKYNLYNLTYVSYNTNGVPFIVNEKFFTTPYQEKFVTTNPVLFKPFFYVYDTNFANVDVKSATSFVSPYTDIAGFFDTEKFKFNKFSSTRDNVFAVSLIDPVFINQVGTYFLYLNWTEYNNVNLFFGCSSYNLFFTEDSIVFPFSQTVLTEEEKWYELFNFRKEERNYFVKAKIIKNTRSSLLEVYVGEESIITNGVSPAPCPDCVFCDFPYSIFKKLKVEKVGDGSGIIKTEPFCIDCGDICEVLYPIGSTITVKASAAKESVFSGWLGGGCEGVAGDCLVTVKDETTLSAVFTKLPRYNLSITVPREGTTVNSITNDIFCVGPGTCTYNFLGGTAITLSASEPPQGLQFRGYEGLPVANASSPVFSFFVNSNISLTAVYENKDSSLFVYNEYQDSQSFYLLGRESIGDSQGYRIVGRPLLQDRSERGADICGYVNRSLYFSPGTVYISLCPDFRIEFFHEFTVPTGINCTLSGVLNNPNYVFVGYLGAPCEGLLDYRCNFRVRNVLSLSALFTPPFVSFNIAHYPALRTFSATLPISSLGVVGVFTSDNKISCETYKLNQTCANVYFSGAAFTLSALPADGSFVKMLCGTDGFYVSGTNITGKIGLTGFRVLTKNTTLSVFSEALQYRTLHITKTSWPGDIFSQIVVTPGQNGQISYILQTAQNQAILTYPLNTDIEILLEGARPVSKPVYTIGFSGLRYPFISIDSSGVVLNPNPSVLTQEANEIVVVSDGLNQTDFSGPPYSIKSPFDIQFRESLLKLTQNASVSTFFVAADYKTEPFPTPSPTPTPTSTPTPTPTSSPTPTQTPTETPTMTPTETPTMTPTETPTPTPTI